MRAITNDFKKKDKSVWNSFKECLFIVNKNPFLKSSKKEEIKKVMDKFWKQFYKVQSFFQQMILIMLLSKMPLQLNNLQKSKSTPIKQKMPGTRGAHFKQNSRHWKD